MAKIIHYYRKTEPSHSLLPSIKEELKDLGLAEEAAKFKSVETESCFNVQLDAELMVEQTERLEWLLAETFEPESLRFEKSCFDIEGKDGAAWQ